MSKKIFIILFVLAFAKGNVSFAQFTLGIRGGVNFSTLKTDNTQSVGANFQQSLDTKTGYVGGVYARIGSKIFIQPELIFSAKGGSVNFLKNGSSSQTIAIDYTNIDIPLLVGVKFAPLRLYAGPMASFTVSSKGLDEAIRDYSSDLGKSFKNASYGYQAGGGLDLGALSVDLRYEGSLSQVAGLNSTNINFSQKVNLWQLTLGLRIL